MAAIVVEVPCSGSVHRLELRSDGTAEMLDHDEAVVRAFVAFNAEPPECLAALDEAREDLVDFVLYNAEMADKVKGLFACDFAEHVLYIFEDQFPDDNRPRKAIQTARAYWRGKATREQLKEARADAAWSAARADAAAEEAVWVAGGAYAARAAYAAARAWAAETEAAWSADRSAARAAEEAAYAADAAAWAEEAADEAAGVAAWKVAKEAERRWQLGRIIKVLDAVRRGKRWPRLS